MIPTNRVRPSRISLNPPKPAFFQVHPHFRGAYTASKHAVAAWCDSLRAELVGSGVGVTVISPGYVNTNLSRNALTSSGRRLQ